jgi:hypothetical protein
MDNVQGRLSEPAAKTQREETDAERCSSDGRRGGEGRRRRCLVRAARKTVDKLSRRRGERPGGTCKSESNQAACDHGVTGVPRVTL